MRLKYRCSHCNHVFELEEKEFQRCPNCFWTTSLVPFGEAQKEIPVQVKKEPLLKEKRPAIRIPWKPIVIFALVIGVGTSAFIFIKNNLSSFKLPAFNLKSDSEPNAKPKKAVKKNIASAEKTLGDEELKTLSRQFKVTIPRQLTDDEEEILKKQVSNPVKISEKPKISSWTKSDFEKSLESEQKQRKILLGWLYIRSLGKVFEKNYLPAVQAFEKGEYILARELFIKSLSFPVYQNNVARFRAIVLVMLRSYVNDVIGKIAVVNQHVLAQNLSVEANGIFESYQAISPVLELHDWEKALQMIVVLKNRIQAFESQPKDGQVIYPPAFGQIDAELRTAIQTEAAPEPEGAVSFKALAIDLGLKEKVVRQNTSEELVKVQKIYEQALQMIEAKDWEAAHNTLAAIEFPSELVDDAKQKIALIDKILAVQESKSK